MMFIMPYWGLNGLIVFIIVFYFYMTRKFKYWKKRGVSEIPPIPFLGSFVECIFMKKSTGQLLKEFYDEAVGQPYVGFFVFDKPFLLIRDHKLVKNILVKDFDHFSDRYFTPDKKDRLGYANLFFVKNPVWKMLRLKMTPFFTPRKLKKMVDLIKECAKNLSDYLDLQNLEDKGKIIDVKELATKFTTDVIGSTAFGLDMNSFKDPNAEFRKHGVMMFDTDRSFELIVISFIPILCRLTGMTVLGKQTDAFLRKVFWEMIIQREKSGEIRNDLLDILIDLKRNHDENIKDFKFDGDDLLAQAAVFFAAAYETTATTISFTLYELALHPEIQNILREEIIQELAKSDGNITYEMIMSLSCLDMVLFEVMRIYPPIEYLQRVTTKTYKVPNSDLVIEKGTPIFISVRGLHYDPQYFPDPNKFDPERFNEENKRNRPSFVHLPFGEGPHGCIGIRMAFLEMKLALVKILSKFEVAPCEKTLIPMKLDPTAILTMPLGKVIYLNIRKINLEEL
ncbi:cytochrome P450 6k1 [Camponotus floridanus]|nr:cytochrome P450 6k1 [Camponotus floridanus]